MDIPNVPNIGDCMKAATLEHIESKLDRIREMYPKAIIEISNFKDGYGIGFIFQEINDDTIDESIEGIPVLFVYYEC